MLLCHTAEPITQFDRNDLIELFCTLAFHTNGQWMNIWSFVKELSVAECRVKRFHTTTRKTVMRIRTSVHSGKFDFVIY